MSATLVHVAALTHVGRRRSSNEDCIAVGSQIRSESMETPWLTTFSLPDPCLCLVADGMGGHPAGDIASRYAIELLSVQLPDALGSDRAIALALRRTNRALFDLMIHTPAVAGMGTTIAGLGVCADSIVAFNVGDSRIYRLSERGVNQLSIDDSEEIMTSILALDFPTRALSQCLGGYPGCEEITPHLLRADVESNCTYLLCSDGLYDMLSDAAIASCVSADLEDSVRELFDSAMNAGGIDNISIILARIETGTTA